MLGLRKKLYRNALDVKTASGKSIEEIVFEPLDKAGIAPLVVDVGARNGMMFLPQSYANHARLVGFEPNAEEYQKLITGTTDSLAANANIPKFTKETYHPYALWSRPETRTLFVTVGPGATTMMGGADPQVTKRMFLDQGNENGLSLYDQHCEVREQAEVHCKTLDEATDNEEMIDFLKVDVEGAELDVFEGGIEKFKSNSILFIMTEFYTLPIFEKHPVIGDLHAFLNRHGFRLLDLDLAHSTYRRGPTSIPESLDRRLIFAGDLFLSLDPDRYDLTPETLQRLAAISIAQGFYSYGISLLRSAALSRPDDIDAADARIAKMWTSRRLRRSWATLPAKTKRLTSRILTPRFRT